MAISFIRVSPAAGLFFLTPKPVPLFLEYLHDRLPVGAHLRALHRKLAGQPAQCLRMAPAESGLPASATNTPLPCLISITPSC